MREIIVDNFAGGGGASTGIEIATGRSVDIAINHDPEAIRMHMANHPDTKHYCESVWDVDPVQACAGHPVGLAWFSPDCKHFSKAKGGKPVDKNIRGLAWVVLKWAALVRPRVIMLENVEEFQTWGPLIPMRDKKTGRIMVRERNHLGEPYLRVAEPGEVVEIGQQVMQPDPRQKGKTYRKWKSQLEALGYQIETRELVAADYGAPTKRKRFFMIARCDGQPIIWPEPTHGPRNSEAVRRGKLLPYVPAAEIIDWSIPCPSIFGRKKPLAENTMKRIARGLKKFVIDNPGEPIMTLDASNRYGLVSAFICQQQGKSIGTDIREPLNTMTGVNHMGEVIAFLTKYYGCGTGQDINEPLDTVTAKDRFGLVEVRGTKYQIVDIGLRMLEPHELYAAQGFPADYIIDRDNEGNTITKTEQVKRCGNAVCPPIPAALVKANLPELCTGKRLPICRPDRLEQEKTGQLRFV